VSKLTDFGIAARAGDRPFPAGTMMYAPPEQFAGAPARPASDVYAATATFYECLAGRPPFSGDTVEALMYQHMSQPVPLDPVPEPLRPLVAAGMAKEPGDRPTDGVSLVSALNAAASGAYGRDWEERGRSHLAEAALLLALLWPSGASPAVQGSATERVNLSRNPSKSREARHLWHLRHLRHLLHLRHRRFNPVKAAIAVVINKTCPSAPSAAAHPGFGGDVGEGAIAIVVVENVAAKVGNQEIHVAVVVVVTGGHTHSVQAALKASLLRHVSERPIAIVPVKAVPEARVGFVRRRAMRHGIENLRSIYKKQVEPAIVVVVEHGDSANHRFGQVLLAGAAGFLFEPYAGLGRHVFENLPGVIVREG